MRYVLRQKLIAFGSDFTILDGDGRVIYFVDGQAFADRLSFKDADGRELAFIQRRAGAEQPMFEIHRDHKLFATVTAPELNYAECRFFVDVPGPDDFDARGDLVNRDFVFTRAGKTVATVARQGYTLSDVYTVDVVDGQDDVFLLASAVVLDLMSDEKDAEVPQY